MEEDPSTNPDWQEFAAEDPFNSTFVEGRLSHHQGDDYGALLIEKVNGEKAPQLIYCTPKLAYPFDKQGNWHFPKATEIQRYTKLDGTNIFAFTYQDAKGQDYLSYKTRLTPFLRNARFGPFLEMWQEILKNDPRVAGLPRTLGMNVSYELWGARNPHLMLYEVPLQASFLFARAGQTLLPPRTALGGRDGSEWVGFYAPFLGRVEKDYVWNYQQAQETLEQKLVKQELGYQGDEGEVWYLQDVLGAWHLFKVKPTTIEAIHWASGGLGKNIILATCKNAFENWDKPTVDQIKQLLAEEFPQAMIEGHHYLIEKTLAEATTYQHFVEKVLQAYRELELSILDHKGEVMRALSSQFERGKMGQVYSVVWNHEVR